jgi:hypothetical protein
VKHFKNVCCHEMKIDREGKSYQNYSAAEGLREKRACRLAFAAGLLRVLTPFDDDERNPTSLHSKCRIATTFSSDPAAPM